MVWLLRKCKTCGSYTLKTGMCPHCRGKLRTPHPPKFSPDDRYLKYRVIMKRENAAK